MNDLVCVAGYGFDIELFWSEGVALANAVLK
jgi:hypothetical protein